MKAFTEQYRYSLVILRELVKTDFKLRYQGSILGIAWSVLKPLMLFAVMYTVFVRFLRFTDGTPLFPVSLLLGLGLWQFFSEASTIGLYSVVARGDVLRKIHFPNFIVVISASIGSLIGLGINMLVVLVFALFNGVTFTWRVLLVPLNVVQLYVITVGITLILATLYVSFRDIAHIWDVCLQILFYGIPIFYPLSMVRNVFPTVSKLMLLNPLTQVIQDVRHNLIDPQNVPTIWTEWHSVIALLVPILASFLLLALGIWIFRRSSRKFMEIL